MVSAKRKFPKKERRYIVFIGVVPPNAPLTPTGIQPVSPQFPYVGKGLAYQVTAPAKSVPYILPPSPQEMKGTGIVYEVRREGDKLLLVKVK